MFKKNGCYLLLVVTLMLSGATLPAFAQGGGEKPSVGVLFIQAMEKKDEAAMRELIKTRTKEFPMEVKAMIEYAMSSGVDPREQDFLFQVTFAIASMYGEETGDKRLLGAVKASRENLEKQRKASSLPPQSVDKAKKELTKLGGGNWRVVVFRMGSDGGLDIEVDVKESSGGELTPHIEFKKAEEAKELVRKNLPNAKKGKIVWSSMGVGLKTAFWGD